MNSTGSPNYAMEGALFMIYKVRKTPEITPQSVKKFDGTFEVDPSNVEICTNCRFDIELHSGVKFEYKSYGESSVRKIGEIKNADEPFIKQHMSYLKDGTSIDNIKYEFDISKLDETYTVIIDKKNVVLSAHDFIKHQFKKMYNANTEDIIDNMNTLIKTELNLLESAEIFTDAQLNLLLNKIVKLN